MEVHTAIHGQVNPDTLQYNDVKIGDKVAIVISAWNWIELASEIHAHFRNNGDTPEVMRYLIGKIFEALTPEDYRKALVAEYAEAQERAMRSHPLYQMSQAFSGNPDDGPINPEDFRDDDATD